MLRVLMLIPRMIWAQVRGDWDVRLRRWRRRMGR